MPESTPQAHPLVKLPDGEILGNGELCAKNSSVLLWFANVACGGMMLLSSHLEPKSVVSEKRWLIVSNTQQAWIFPNTPKKKNSRTDDEVEQRFYTLLSKFQSETKTTSLVSRKLIHPAYRGIAALGPQAVPLILKELQKGRAGIWLQTLEDITGVNPIHPDHETDSAMMILDWLQWGIENGAV